ncbi:MAG: nicotinate-nicotinamide nucleotide adenylyltransferase, partial [Deferribacterales bacterium]
SDLDKDIFLISDYELNNNETSYTYNTLKHFNNFYHPQELFFLVGSDIFATIETWHKWDKLFELSNFIIVNRPNHPFSKMIKEIPELLREKIVDSKDFIFGMTNKIILTKIKEVPISSTQIRESIKTGFYKDFLDEKVYKYIIENRLYQEV